MVSTNVIGLALIIDKSTCTTVTEMGAHGTLVTNNSVETVCQIQKESVQVNTTKFRVKVICAVEVKLGSKLVD